MYGDKYQNVRQQMIVISIIMKTRVMITVVTIAKDIIITRKIK